MSLLPWGLLVSTILVRYLFAKRNRAGFWLDAVSVPGWLAYYALNGDYMLLAIPLVFGWLDLMALWRYWR